MRGLMGAAKKITKISKDSLNPVINANKEITILKKEISSITDTFNSYENSIISKIDALKKEISQDIKSSTEKLDQRASNKITVVETKIDTLKKYIKNNFIILFSILIINFISIPVSLSIFSNNQIIKDNMGDHNSIKHPKEGAVTRDPGSELCINRAKLRNYINNQPTCE